MPVLDGGPAIRVSMNHHSRQETHPTTFRVSLSMRLITDRKQANQGLPIGKTRTPTGRDYAANPCEKAPGFNAPGHKRGISRVSAWRQLLGGVRTRKENAPFHGALQI